MTATTTRNVSIALWGVQLALAALFLFAGGFKLAAPAEDLTKDFPGPAAFLRFIGACEVLGALGLVLPGLSGVRPRLTPLAALGLVIIMAGAVVLTLAAGDGAVALVPFVVGVLAATVAVGRWRVAPHRERPRGVARPISRPSY